MKEWICDPTSFIVGGCFFGVLGIFVGALWFSPFKR